MTLTKKNVFAALPSFREELLEHAPTQRHVRRLDKVLSSLRRRGMIVDHKLEKKNEEGEVVTTIAYAKNYAA